MQKNELRMHNESSNHIQIINFNEWPILNEPTNHPAAQPPSHPSTHSTSYPTTQHPQQRPATQPFHHPPRTHPKMLLSNEKSNHERATAVCKQCNECAIAALLVSLTLCCLAMCAVQATPSIGCAFVCGCACVCARWLVCKCVRACVYALLAQLSEQRRCVAACIFMREQ